MESIKHKCKACAQEGYATQPHAVIAEFNEVEPNKIFLQCLGCGNYGWQNVSNE